MKALPRWLSDPWVVWPFVVTLLLLAALTVLAVMHPPPIFPFP